MKVGQAQVVLAAFIFTVACDETPLVPSPPAFASAYTVQFAASASCPNAGQGTGVFQRTFQFDMIAAAPSPHHVILSLPAQVDLADPSRRVPNSGDLSLALFETSGTLRGTLVGSGLAANATHSFGVRESSARQGPAQPATASGRVIPGGTLEGTFTGFATFSIFLTSAGGECTASDQSWRATPRF